MKSKRKIHLLIVAVVLLVLGAPVAYLGARQVLKHRIAGWRRDGIAASIAGRHDQAADLLVRYLKRRPEDPEALSYYIKSREVAELPNGQHLAETIAALKMLIGQRPDSLDDRRHLLELYVKLDRRPEALDTAKAILNTPASAKDVRTRELQTEVLMRMRQDRDALAAAEEWAKLAPGDVKPHMARLTARVRLGHPRDAIVADAQKLREAHPGDPQFELLQGVAYAQTGDDAQAAQWLKTAASHPGLSDEFVKTLVAQFDTLGMSEDALGVLQDLVKRGAGTDVRHTLARRLWERGHWDGVVEMLADLDPADPQSDATLVAFKAIAYANLGKKADADACRTALAQRNRAAARAWTQLLGRVIDAAAVDDKQLIAACREALALDPQNTYLQYYLGDANARLGELDLAIDAWRRAAAQNAVWNVPALRLVEALLQKGRPEQAMWVASSAARRSPTNAAAVITLARAWSAGVETGGAAHADELLKLVTEVQRQMPGEDQTLLIQVQLLAQGGKKDEAIAAARAAVAREPAPGEPMLLALASLSRKFSLGLEAICFARSEQAHGLTAPLAYARAVDQFVTGQGAAGLKLFDELAAKGGKADDKSWRLARAQYLDITGSADAHAAWVALGDAFLGDLPVQQAVASARAVRGDWAFMPKTVERLRALTGEKGLAWRLAQARLMVESARNDADYGQGSVQLSEIIKEYPSLAEPRVLLARALVQMKRTDGAVEQLSAAAAMEPNSVPIALQLAALLQSKGDFERVRQELDRVAPQLRSSAQRRQAALLLAQQGNTGEAVQVLESPKAQQDDGGADEDLFKAIMYRKNRQPDRAEAVVRKLLQEKPDVATIEFAVSLFASQGKAADAEQALARLESLKLEPGIKELLWGGYYAQVGKLAEAVEQYRAATKSAPGNSAAWRALIVFHAATGHTADALVVAADALRAVPADKSLKAINDNAELLREAGSAEDLRPVVVAFIRDPLNGEPAVELLRTVRDARQSNDMERMASALQQLVERRPGFLPNRTQLILCYWAMGRRTDAIAAAQQAMNVFPADPAPARLALQLSNAAGRWQEAQNAAQAVKKRSPGDAMAADVAIAGAQMGLRQYGAAAAQLQPYVAAAKSDPEKYADPLTAYAIALANAGRASEAAELLWPLTGKAAQWRVRWMQVATELMDGAEARAWLDRIAAALPPDAVPERVVLAESYDRLGRDPQSGREKDAQLIAKANDLFKQVIAQPDVDARFVLSAASQAERCGDLGTAEGLYRRALSMDNSLFIAQNNLASVLTRRPGGDLKEAERLAKAAAKQQPRLATLHDTLASVQAKAGNATAAAASMQLAVGLEPDNATWRVRLAQYLLNAGQQTDAAKAIDEIEARRLNVRDLPPEIQQQLSAIRRQLRGQRDVAKAG